MASITNCDITLPLWDQNTFMGRFKHFALICNPLLSFVPEKELYEAKDLYMKFKAGTPPPNVTREQIVRCKQLYESAFHPDSGELQNVFGRMSFQMPGGCLVTGGMLQFYRAGSPPANVTHEQLVRCKQLYESAFHPDSGELQNVFGRMSFQMPGGCIITGGMLQFYKTTRAVVFWQWINQSFNALVNYTNRNANSPLTTTQMGVAYVSATSAALATALIFKFVVQKRAKNPIMARFVPFVAVAAANCVNIPLMRQNEIRYGLEVTDDNGKIIGKSQLAPAKGIAQVITARVIMCSPGMLLLPVIMERLEPRPWMQRIRPAHGLIQTAIVGAFLTFMVPVACAVFPQRCPLSTQTLKKYEKENYEELVKNTGGNPPEYVYFNKGL